jgi:1-acyl-sn-glycerol-3-phosphate acyltransferase
MNQITPKVRARGPFARSAPYAGLFPEFVRGLSWLYLKATGWRVGSDWPAQIPKSVIVAAPHTSNWDGLTMVAIAGWYRVKLSWMGKASLVKGPLGWLVKRSGCVPVERSTSQDVVEQMRRAFAASATLHLAVAPEGTRNANPNWKTGFYHIARSAGVKGRTTTVAPSRRVRSSRSGIISPTNRRDSASATREFRWIQMADGGKPSVGLAQPGSEMANPKFPNSLIS